jgi:PAS domain S-box-containing protein
MRRGREQGQSELDEIRTILNLNPRGLSIQEIAEIMGANRNSVAKYLEILQMQGSVDLRKIGNSKIYVPTFRYSAKTLHRLCPDGLLILNHELMIVHCNNLLSDSLKSVSGAITGITLNDLVYPLKTCDKLLALATAAVRGKEGAINIVPRWGSLTHELQLDLLPIVFSSGRPGAAVIIKGLYEEKSGKGLEGSGLDFERMLLDQMVEVFCRLSLDMSIIEVNQAFCRMSGHCHDELIGFRFRLMVPEEDRARTNGRLLTLTPQSPVILLEHRILTVDGHIRWVRWTYRGIFSWSGGLTEYLCTGLDITDQKNTAERLEHLHTHFEEVIQKRTDELREINRQLFQEVSHREAAEQQLRLTQYGVDNAAEMILWTDQYGIIRLINRRGKEVLGLDVGEPLMTYIKNNYPKHILWQELRELLIKDGLFKIERVIRRVDGTWFPVEMMINHLSFGGKEYSCFFIRDVSERKGYETALQRAEEKYRLLIENARDVIFRISIRPEFSIDYLSPSIELLTGFTQDQFYANPVLVTQVLNEQDYGAFLSYLDDPRIFEGPTTVRFRRKDKSWGRLEISVVFIRDDQGCIIALEGIGRDISIRKKGGDDVGLEE